MLLSELCSVLKIDINEDNGRQEMRQFVEDRKEATTQIELSNLYDDDVTKFFTNIDHPKND